MLFKCILKSLINRPAFSGLSQDLFRTSSGLSQDFSKILLGLYIPTKFPIILFLRATGVLAPVASLHQVYRNITLTPGGKREKEEHKSLRTKINRSLHIHLNMHWKGKGSNRVCKPLEPVLGRTFHVESKFGVQIYYLWAPASNI